MIPHSSGFRPSSPPSKSSQRTLGSSLILLYMPGFEVKMDPSVRWDDGFIFNGIPHRGGINRHWSLSA